MTIPSFQHAIQLTGPDELRLNDSKPVPEPGPHEILARTEAVGLCFSDLKLLHQFDRHVRKGAVQAGISPVVLAEHAAYVPDQRLTVPGHEVVCRVVAVGSAVYHYRVGQRWIVQADFRMLRTQDSNAAFGYNFEGGLQEFVLMDERIVGAPDSPDAYLIAAPDDRAASQLALVEPWACVEHSYVKPERQRLRAGGTLLMVVEPGHACEGLAPLWREHPEPAAIWWQGADTEFPSELVTRSDVRRVGPHEALPDDAFDDILYFGANAARLSELDGKLRSGGLINVVLGGHRIDRPVNVGIGRIHYGGTRWVGTNGHDPADGYAMIPANGEIRPNEEVLVVGAGGPMGQMHVIRNLCAEPSLRLFAADLSASRLDVLRAKVERLGRSLEIGVEPPSGRRFDYVALMAPIAALVGNAIASGHPGARVNLFAGIPASVYHPIDLGTLIERRIYLFGTSGSQPEDMRTVLGKVIRDELDTNTSVAAVSGMAGAAEGLRAVEDRTLDGKIVVYPELTSVGLIPLEALAVRYPTVSDRLVGGQWTPEAEAEFLRIAR